jgi:hypothetical protein
MIRTATAAMIAVAATLLTSGCGGSHQGPASYLDQAPNGTVFVQWTRDGSNVNGSLSEAYIDASNPLELQSENASFHGIVNGSSITLTFDQGFGTSTNWNGTLDGDKLTLSYTGSDGTVKTLDFQPGTIDDYNQAVAASRQRVAAAKGRKARADAAAAASAQQQAAAQTLDSDGSSVADAISYLHDSTAQPSTLSGAADDVRSMRGDVGTAASDLQTTRHGDQFEICSDADTVSSDADTVVSDQDTLISDNDSLASDFQSITSDIQQLQSAWSKFKQDRLAAPGYTPTGAPSAAQVSNAITAAKQAMQSAQRTMNGYLATGRSLVAQANGYAADAQKICSSSGG